jgi:DNA-binding LacI/PurR family transcriptional regulator
MARRPTVADVAREAGVSATTVSHALSGKGRVDAATRRHVQAVADRLGYVPSRAARSLALGRSDTIGLLLPSLAHMPLDELMRTDWYGRVVAAASGAALQHGRALTVLPALQSPGDLEAFGLEGIIVLDPVDHDPRLEMLRASRSRVVILGRGSEPDAFGSVVPDISAGMAILLDHLWEQGARSIAVVQTDLPWSQGRDAVASYRAWCKEHRTRARVVTGAVSQLESRDSIAAAGQAAADRLLARGSRPDAIVGLLEDFGRGIIAAARQHGLSVPDDVLVAQDIDGVVAQVNDPPITALDLNVNELLAAAVELVVDRETPSSVSVPVALNARASTARRAG